MPSKRDYHPRKFLPDGTLNPAYKTRKHTPGNKGGKKLSKFDRGRFITWDGEGITREDGKHVYALLANSSERFISNPAGLSTMECLEFLCAEGTRERDSIHVGFVFSYDTAMVLFADMDYETVKSIWRDKSKYGTEWNGFRIKYRDRKLLQIQKIGSPKWIEKDNGKNVMNIVSSIMIWDVFGFFQSSFVAAIKEWLGKDYPDLPMIESGKLHRGSFTREQLEVEILPYCLAELRALVLICQRLHAALVAADIKISRWDGAGAISAAMLAKNGIKEHIGEQPAPVENASQHAYFGGRIEIFKYGRYDGIIHHYDIRSAYPYAQTWCPSLVNGTWHKVSTENRPPFSISRVKWVLSDDDVEQHAPWSIFPFPYRTHKGNVIFPYEGEGWYWEPEVYAAKSELHKYRDRYPNVSLDITETWTFVPDNGFLYPFQYVREYYDIRAEWKRQGNPAQMPMKLGVNGGYGKLAQHSGYDEETGRRPPFHCMPWAGYITSVTRAKLYKMAMQKPHGILFIATDGIYSMEPLDCYVSDSLGEWDYERHDEIIIVQSGVYFVRTNGKWKTYCRGFDKGTINHERILETWRARKTKTAFPSTRFISIGSAVSSLSRWAVRGCWLGISVEGEDGRRLELNTWNTKRDERRNTRGKPDWTKRGRETPADTLIPTFAAFNLTPDKMSMRYRLPWEMDLETVDGVDRRIYDDEQEMGEVM